MAKSPPKFTSARLVEVVCDVYLENGTRRDVVLRLMEDNEEDTADEKLYAKMYNSVTQRMRHLEKRDDSPVTFPKLKEGRRGSSQGSDALAEMQASIDAAIAAKKAAETPDDKKEEGEEETK